MIGWVLRRVQNNRHYADLSLFVGLNQYLLLPYFHPVECKQFLPHVFERCAEVIHCVVDDEESVVVTDQVRYFTVMDFIISSSSCRHPEESVVTIQVTIYSFCMKTTISP